MPEAFFLQQKLTVMKENFKIIASAFEKAGVEIAKAEYSITEYSLNTELSFKFSNREEFLEFLNLGPDDTDRVEKVDAVFIAQGINPGNFFYVNFYPPKVVEM